MITDSTTIHFFQISKYGTVSFYDCVEEQLTKELNPDPKSHNFIFTSELLKSDEQTRKRLSSTDNPTKADLLVYVFMATTSEFRFEWNGEIASAVAPIMDFGTLKVNHFITHIFFCR
jgi:hypothetical protein